jgi:hypothetical protein
MSLQDDHFDLEDYFKNQIKNGRAKDRDHAINAQQAYRRIWGQFCELEAENEKMAPVVSAVSTIVQHVIETHYK